MDSGRSAKKPSEIRIRTAANGGYTVTHHHDNFGAGESYKPPQDHVFSDHAAMMAHVGKVTGGKGDYTGLTGDQAGKAQAKGYEHGRAGIKPAHTRPGPTVHSRGAGVD